MRLIGQWPRLILQPFIYGRLKIENNQMSNNSKYPWFVLDVMIFVIINLLVLWWIKPLPNIVSHFSPWFILLLSLAVFRGADVISNEAIFAPVREPFVRHVHQHDKEIEKPLKFGFRGAMGSLLYCPSCTGVWVAMVLVYGYLMKPGVFSIIIIILAVSALERFLTSFYNIEKKVPKSL
jgi:hypothetical protein